ncbi:hypothetical protein R50072_32360 [Simiduia litorea]
MVGSKFVVIDWLNASFDDYLAIQCSIGLLFIALAQGASDRHAVS